MEMKKESNILTDIEFFISLCLSYFLCVRCILE